MKRIVLIGASGSIGEQSLNVMEHHREDFELVAVGVGRQVDKLHAMIKKFPSIRHIAFAEAKHLSKFEMQYPDICFYVGDDGLKQLAALQDYDLFVNAVVGFRGLIPTLTAIEHDHDVALANKESLVAGGDLVKKALKEHQRTVYPIDSEHSAIFQCLQGSKHEEIDKLIITASGGSFRDKKREDLANVSVQEALKHPNWNMGGRITIDSATMMNKGFEVIEAHYLFDIVYDDIDVVLHKESVIHSMIQFCDHAILAQLGTADMRLPIQYALSYPKRLAMLDAKPFCFWDYPQLHFAKPDEHFYPLLKLAYEVGRKGGNLGAVLNGADEEAVALFLKEEIAFLDIERLVKAAVEHADYISDPTLDDVIEADRYAREFVREMAKGGPVSA